MVVYVQRRNVEFCKHFNALSRMVEGSVNVELAAVPLAALSMGRKVKAGRVSAFLRTGAEGNEYARQMNRYMSQYYAENPKAVPVRLDDVRRFVAQVDTQGVVPAWREWVKRYGAGNMGALRRPVPECLRLDI